MMKKDDKLHFTNDILKLKNRRILAFKGIYFLTREICHHFYLAVSSQNNELNKIFNLRKKY